MGYESNDEGMKDRRNPDRGFLSRCQRLGIGGEELGELEQILNESNIPRRSLYRVVKDSIKDESLDKSEIAGYVRCLSIIYDALNSHPLTNTNSDEGKCIDMRLVDKYVTAMMEREDLLDNGSVGEVLDVVLGIARIGDNQYENTNLRYALKIVEDFKEEAITFYDVMDKAPDLYDPNVDISPVKILYECMTGHRNPVPFYDYAGNEDAAFHRENDPELSDREYKALFTQ
ncbi:MAG TPA: hypothetical protein PLX15_04585 [Candidatus Woesearchaeota archaeon]|nr:hypothetical protein [Candidatus Woesearchaeota archaeon]